MTTNGLKTLIYLSKKKLTDVSNDNKVRNGFNNVRDVLSGGNGVGV